MRVSPNKAIVRFGTKGNLSPRYVGLFPIVVQIGTLAYRLDLLESMCGVHKVFHFPMLRKYLKHPEHEISLESLTIEQYLIFESHPVRILEKSKRVLRHNMLKYVKVLW